MNTAEQTLSQGVSQHRIVIRTATEDDWKEIFNANGRTFGFRGDHVDVQAWQKKLSTEDILVAVDTHGPYGPFIVGTAMFYRMTMTVPGGAQMKVAGGAQIMVSATHRRQGIFRKMFTELLQKIDTQGYGAIIGMPSEAGIYNRFGLGVAGYSRKLRIDRRSAMLRHAPAFPLEVREVQQDEAQEVLPEMHARWQEQAPGATSRSDVWWEEFFADRDKKDGNSMYYMIHPEGYLTYRITQEEGGAVASVYDFFALTKEAHTQLTQAILGLDVFHAIDMEVTVDDSLPLKLVDQRTAKVTEQADHLWVRFMDVPAALAVRSYAGDLDAVIEVDDPVLNAGGRFALKVENGTASCTVSEGPADISLGLPELSSLYFGSHSTTELVRAGRVKVFTPGLLKDLDVALSTDQQPFAGTRF